MDKPGGKRELKFGKDDEFLALKSRSIPRDDVAEVRAAECSSVCALVCWGQDVLHLTLVLSF